MPVFQFLRRMQAVTGKYMCVQTYERFSQNRFDILRRGWIVLLG